MEQADNRLADKGGSAVVQRVEAIPDASRDRERRKKSKKRRQSRERNGGASPAQEKTARMVDWEPSTDLREFITRYGCTT
jgi:hypothetical protein